MWINLDYLRQEVAVFRWEGVIFSLRQVEASLHFQVYKLASAWMSLPQGKLPKTNQDYYNYSKVYMPFSYSMTVTGQ